MTTETKPTAPAQRLKVVHFASEAYSDVLTFDDGSLWRLREDGTWRCLWQPSTHLVPIDRIALNTLLDIARDLQSQIVAGQVCTASLDYAIDAAKEALGVDELCF